MTLADAIYDALGQLQRNGSPEEHRALAAGLAQAIAAAGWRPPRGEERVPVADMEAVRRKWAPRGDDR